MAFAGTGKIWMNGKFVDWADATIHVASHVIHYGSGVFEGARCYDTKKGPAVLRLDAHIKRLLASAKIYRMDSPFTQQQLEAAVLDTIRVNSFKACYIRPLMYRGYNALGVNPLPCPGRRGRSWCGNGAPISAPTRSRKAWTSASARGTAWRPNTFPVALENQRQLRERGAHPHGSGNQRLQRRHRARHVWLSSAKAAARTSSSCGTARSIRRR